VKRFADELRIAVVIPTFNEEAGLAATLCSIEKQDDEVDLLLVVDGGSKDSTAPLAERHGAQVIVSPRRGRGCQIAAAVSQLHQEIVVVIHADMVLPAGALARIRKWLTEHPTCPGGCLGHRFNSPRLLLRLVELWDRLRAQRGMSYGDQAQFFRCDFLLRQGGFPDQPIMEDIELCRRLNRLGRSVYLNCPVAVSSRRFDRLGFWRTVLTNMRLRFAYRYRGLQASESIYRHYYRTT
jgi:rSAM/selenodomain-associated transferase 2